MEVVISLDEYDDIFSDFDIRGYADRSLSEDFLDELRLRLRKDQDGSEVSIVLLMPERRRRKAAEPPIVERLRSFFSEREASYVREDRHTLRRGLAFIGIGLALSISANLIVESVLSLPLFNDFLLIPSWFFVWSGFDYLIKREELRKKRRYYASLLAAKIVFRSRRVLPGPIELLNGPYRRAPGF